MDKLIVKTKDNTIIPITVRIGKELQEKYDELAAKTNRSRNELIVMALEYAIDKIEIE